jgi:DNA-binding CsgD family transcriptional regulator/GAF domain-containing protein
VSATAARRVLLEREPRKAAISADGAFRLVDFSSALGATADPSEVARRFVDASAEFVPAAAVVVYLFEQPGGRLLCARARGVGDEYLERYEHSGRRRDPVFNEAVRRGAPVGVCALMDRERWTSLPVYREVFALHELVDVLVAPLLVGEALIGALHFMRRPGEPPFDRRDRATATTMARVVARGVVAARRAADRLRERSCLRAAVEFASDAMVIRHEGSDVAYVNAAARRLVGEIRDGERVLATIGREEGLRARAVRLAAGHEPAHVRVRTNRASHDASIFVSVLELHEDGDLATSAGRAETLTRRELEVGELAASGLRVADIAERLLLSPHTVKQHLKSCYSKLGVHSRIGLARQLA